MHRKPRPDRSAAVSLRVLLLLLASALALPFLLRAAAPQWWLDRGVIKLNPTTGQPLAAADFAALNQGQLKKIATAAYDELESRLPGGAGSDLKTLLERWCQTDATTHEFLRDTHGQLVPKVTTATEDFATVNLGQLKAVAAPFYDRLIATGFALDYPWGLGSDADFAMANLGQAKNVFNFQFVIVPPEALAAQAMGAHSIHLDWTAVPSAQSYVIERCRPVVTDPWWEPWFITIDTISATATQYDDNLLDAETVYEYRVSAQYGPQRSFPSPVAWAKTGRESGGGELGGGQGGDSDGDGINDGDELGMGLDPTNSDTDGDGKPDGKDDYPGDYRRNRDVEPSFYGTIEASSDLSAPLSDQNWATIDDDGYLGLSDLEPSGNLDEFGNPISEVRVIKWADGDVGEDNPVILTQDDGQTFLSQTISPIGMAMVDGVPVLAGNIVIAKRTKQDGDWVDEPGSAGGFKIYQGQLYTNVSTSPHTGQIDYSGGWSHQYQLFSRLGHLFWIKREKNVSENNMPPPQFIQTPMIDNTELSAFQTNTETSGAAPTISGLAISDLGFSVFNVSGYNTNTATPPGIYLATPAGAWQTLTDFPPGVVGVNDQKWIVGTKRQQIPDPDNPGETMDDPDGYEDPTQLVDGAVDSNGKPRFGHGEIGFVWNPTDGMKRFDELLPTEYENQLTDAVPYLITNTRSDLNDSPVIHFMANTLEGPKESETWTWREFRWWRLSDGSPWVEEVKTADTNDDGQYTYHTCIVNAKDGGVDNTSASGGGFQTDTAPPAPSPGVVKTAEPMIFLAHNINLGFDPPMTGDYVGAQHDDPAPPGHKAEWWASVIQGQQNTNLDLNFLSKGSHEGKYDIELANKSTDAAYLTVAPDKTSTGANPTHLTLTGNPDNRSHSVEIDVIPSKGTRDVASRALHIDVLRERTITLGVYYLWDNRVSADGPTFNADFQNTDNIISKLNSIFKPAGVKFVAAAGPHNLNLHYNNEPLNDIVEGAPFVNERNPATETAKVLWPKLWKEVSGYPLPTPTKVNLIICRELNITAESGDIGVTPDKADRLSSLVPTKPFEKNDGTPNKGAGLGLEDFYLTCAHELGHQLFLSTRVVVAGHVQATAAPNPGATGPDFAKAASSFGHDPGRFLQYDYYLDGSPILKESPIAGKDVLDGAVMKGESNKRWLWFRHEDWLRANEQAISKQ